MTQYLIKDIQRKALFLSLMSIGSAVYADCSVNSSGNILIDQIPSITLTENGAPSTQFAAGLSCSGFSLAFANMTYLQYQVDLMPRKYINRQTGETLTANYVDNLNQPITQGVNVDLSTFSIGNFFNGPNASLPFSVRIPAGQIVSPGIYTAETPFNVKWYYSVPAFAVAGLGVWFESPGFSRGFFGGSVGFTWGTGSNSSINLSIEVLPDCRIITNDINFGTAAFAGAFEPVQTAMGITCSTKTPYHVSLNNGLYPRNGDQRGMKLDSNNYYLNYEIYKNTSTERWGSNTQRWSSAAATINAGIYNGKTQQNYAYTAKILENNSDGLPAGTYRDTITVQVEF